MSGDRHNQQRVYWRAPEQIVAWLKGEAARQGTTVAAILSKAVTEYRKRIESHKDDRNEPKRTMPE